jgi:hypothetical protein
MAHFAKLNDNNIVVSVVVVNNLALDSNNEEESGIEFLTNLYGYSQWKQTSYNGNFRGCYAGIGYRYDDVLDEFIPQEEQDSELLEDRV